MIRTPDRQCAVELIKEAQAAGARLAPACECLGLSVRTYLRWRREPGTVREDARPSAHRAPPANRLSEAERAAVLERCHRPEFASLPPGQIVPRLADEGEYLASESSFYRILRDAGEQHRRGRARAPVARARPQGYCAKAPNEVWSWDITWLAGPVQGLFYYLYLIVDLYSRKIVGWEVYEGECAGAAAAVIERAVWAQGPGIRQPLVLHADNGSAFKAATLRVTLERLGVTASYSRPRVSNDNAFSESLFRTLKYVPDYPTRGFADIAEAREWVERFVRWYNTEHRHSAIRFVTPSERHTGHDSEVLAKRHAIYQQAQVRHPERWSQGTRNWTPIGAVYLNPEPELGSIPAALVKAA
jgi:putative transposase